jgi:hypothetical protein
MSARLDRSPLSPVRAIPSGDGSQLTPRELLLVEAVAERVAERLRGVSGDGLVDAGALAVELGVARSFVYEHADELGARRLGNGPRARLRFDVETAREAICRCADRQSQARIASAEAENERQPARARRRLPQRLPQPGAILPVRPRKAA